VLALAVTGSELSISLSKGSPLQVAAWLLNLDVEDVRRFGVCKTGIELLQE